MSYTYFEMGDDASVEMKALAGLAIQFHMDWFVDGHFHAIEECAQGYLASLDASRRKTLIREIDAFIANDCGPISRRKRWCALGAHGWRRTDMDILAFLRWVKQTVQDAARK